MTDQLRLTKEEQEWLRKKSIEINTTLMKNGHKPLDDPKLLHRILEQALPNAKASTDGKIWIDGD